MKNEQVLSRREAMRGLVLLAGGSALLACTKKELACTDAAGLSAEETATRSALEYTDKAPQASKQCDGCQLFKPQGPDACGGCTVVKGPINPKGSCKSWVQKPI